MTVIVFVIDLDDFTIDFTGTLSYMPNAYNDATQEKKLVQNCAYLADGSKLD